MSKTIKAALGILGILCLAVVLHSFWGTPHFAGAVAANSNTAPADVWNNGNFVGGVKIGVSTSDTSYPVLGNGSMAISGIWSLGGNLSTGTGRQEQAFVGSCATATTTLASIANPFSASSTASVIIYATGQATSTNLTVGTTTASTGLTSSNVSTTLVNAATVATTTAVQLISGLTGASAQTSAGSNTTGSVVLGPSERVGIFATSTASGSGAANYTGGLTSCTYKVLIIN